MTGIRPSNTDRARCMADQSTPVLVTRLSCGEGALPLEQASLTGGRRPASSTASVKRGLGQASRPANDRCRTVETWPEAKHPADRHCM